MYRTFYQYLMTLRDPNSQEMVTQFANNAFFDLDFPKQETDYQALSLYLELNAGYLPNMSIFDDAYHDYLVSEQSK